MAKAPSRSTRPQQRPTRPPRRPVRRPEDRAEDFLVGRAVQSGNRADRLMGQDREDFSRKYADGGMVRGCKSSQISGKGFSGNY